MKRMFLSITLCLAFGVNAQTPDWRLVPVKDRSNNVVGYIYHTEAIGRQIGTQPEKVQTGLRLVCAKSDDRDDPLIIVYWEGMFGNIPENVTILVDGRKIGVGQTYEWKRDGPVLHRKISESGEILRAIKTGRTISLSWTENRSVQKTTVFDLRTFNSNIGNFNSSCNTGV